MAAPNSDTLGSSHGYHPVTRDLPGVLAGHRFGQLLALGPGLGDVIDLVDEARLQTSPPVQLPQGIYWFSAVEPPAVLIVENGAMPGPSLRIAPAEVLDGSPLANALAWFDELWDMAEVVP